MLISVTEKHGGLLNGLDLKMFLRSKLRTISSILIIINLKHVFFQKRTETYCKVYQIRNFEVTWDRNVQ